MRSDLEGKQEEGVGGGGWLHRDEGKWVGSILNSEEAPFSA